MTKETIHFIGLGGIGMSGIARIYLSQGHAVQGSDLKKSEALFELEKMGARVLIGHDASFVNGASLVVYSSSISENHPERLAAHEKGLRVLHRAEALAELCREKFTIAVTGTHGKTTTTALVGMILKEAGRDPSIVVGGMVNFFGGNACPGGGKEIVIEADESDSSFLKFSPDLEIITNIEEEHMDHYKDIREVESAYKNFVKRMAKDGQWIGCGEDPRVRTLAAQNLAPCVLYGFDKKLCTLYATAIDECPGGERGVRFDVWESENLLGQMHLKILGRHNVLNALAALAAAIKLGISFQTAKKGLEKYEGAGRRFDVKFEDPEFLVVDDYAHHPTEIQRTLQAAKALKKQRILAIFQPHRYSRTEFLLKEFGKSFSDADELIVTDIYAASEPPKAGVSGESVCQVVRENGHSHAEFIARDKVTAAVKERWQPGDLIITLGAGDITQVAQELSNSLMFPGVRGKILKNEPLSKHTSLKIGGPADFWIEPEDAADLATVLKLVSKKGKKLALMGLGSNVLPLDYGFRGVVVHLGALGFRSIREEGDRIICGAGLPNSLFIQFALEHGFGGCEFLLGIPGNIGGAIAMNAGSHGQSVEEVLERVNLVDFEGGVQNLSKEKIPFSYRSSGIQKAVITSGVFRLPRVPREITQQKLNEYHDYRAHTQDLQFPSAGCLFKNPKTGECSSGKLIDDAGLKGRRVGNAQVSMKHANFMVNLGGASSTDMLQLIEEVQREVKNKFGVTLEMEAKLL